MLVEVDDDLAVGEFGIATRLVAGEGSPEPELPPSLPVDAARADDDLQGTRRGRPVVPDAPPPEPQREVVTLTVAGRKHEVTKASVVLGRSREADVRVSDVNVSRRHAELRQEGAGYWIVDLGSTNGVEVNGKRVDRTRVRDGDRIVLGSTEVVFGRSLPS